jgi:hypothetical protein
VASVLTKRGNLARHANRENHEKMKAQIVVMILKGERYQTASKPPAARGETWSMLFFSH